MNICIIGHTLKLVHVPSLTLYSHETHSEIVSWTFLTLVWPISWLYFIHSALPPGPTPTTISDFWQMIWDHKPAVIVMLTRVQENGKVSLLYWPGDMDHCLPLFLCTHCRCVVVGCSVSLCSLENERFKCCFLPASYQRNNLICVYITLTVWQFQQQQWMAFVILPSKQLAEYSILCSLSTPFHVTPPQYAFALVYVIYERVPARAHKYIRMYITINYI